MNELRVRTYNVMFGEAILISVPDEDDSGHEVTRHILIDVGSSCPVGRMDAIFSGVIEDVLAVLNGQPLDLYVMTHEHIDHVKGLYHYDQNILLQHDLKDKLRIQNAWLTGSSDPDYYTSGKHPEAKKKLDIAEDAFHHVEKLQAAAPELPGYVRSVMAINEPGVRETRVQYLRGLADDPVYVYRGLDIAQKHPFRKAAIKLLAPEEDTSEYYGTFHPVALAAAPGEPGYASTDWGMVVPPSGVDAGAFYNLVTLRRDGYYDNLLALDEAQNNTSVVFQLEWQGWKLLFPADAEIRSWKEMNKRGLLEAVDFLKIGHHGSKNATPPPMLLEKLFPDDGVQRYAVVSTYPDEDETIDEFVHNEVPDRETLQRIRHRNVHIESVIGLPDAGYIDYTFHPTQKTVRIERSG